MSRERPAIDDLTFARETTSYFVEGDEPFFILLFHLHSRRLGARALTTISHRNVNNYGFSSAHSLRRLFASFVSVQSKKHRDP